MTDDFSDELDAIAADLPAIPSDFADLKTLIASLPTPDDASIIGSRTGSPMMDASGTGGVPSALMEELDLPAVVSPSTFRLRQLNLLDDPTFEMYGRELFTLSTSESAMSLYRYINAAGTAWFAKQVGATSVVAQTAAEYPRTDGTWNYFTTAAVKMSLRATGAGTHEMQIRSGNWSASAMAHQPYLSAAVRIARIDSSSATNVTSRTMVLEIFDVTDGIVRASDSIDLTTVLGISGEPAYARLACALHFEGEAYDTHTFQVRIRAVLDTTGSNGATPGLRYHIGEPQLQLSELAEVADFSPLLGSWIPQLVVSYAEDFQELVIAAKKWSDADSRFELYNTGFMQWGGGGGSPDIAIWYVGAGELRIDDGGVGVAVISVNDIVPHKAASWAITYNGDGTVATSVRSGDAGAASTTITYALGKVSSIVSVRGGHTITVTPTYTGTQITGLSRTVV